MRDELLFTDRPVALPQGAIVAEPASGGLQFDRTYRATLEALTEQWTDRAMRQHWLIPMKASRFAVTHVAPAYLEAQETDGLYAVRITIAFEDDGELTTAHMRIAPIAPITTSILIASGYADHWEERLNMLADQLTPEPWKP
ncbi:MAG: hypothetical protein JNM31_01895 [Flavobacteriales bacterium]|nr:hypothetical protein [Flavobacteriales bacterium]